MLTGWQSVAIFQIEGEVIAMTKYTSNLLRGNTDMLLLGLIDEFKTTHGYQIIKEVEKRSNGLFKLKEGTIYPVLRKLESEGLLKGEWKATSSGPERRCYSITQKGREVLCHRRASWENFSNAINLVFKTGEV